MSVERETRSAKANTRRALVRLGLALLTIAGCDLARADEKAGEPLPRGVIVERVACAADPSQTYALYLPSYYQASRRWPIVYLFDPAARGLRAVQAFRSGAETYGFLLAASNNSKNGPAQPSLTAARAMWEDTHARLSIDDRRVDTAGFSGGARVANLVGQLLAGSVAGVIACSGGFPLDRPPARDTPFAYFGIAGDADFDHSEMIALDGTLERLGVPHRLTIFAGGHQWPPEAVCAEALAWMRLREAARGIFPDAELVEKSFAHRLSAAVDDAAQGRLLEADHEYRSLLRDFRGLRDVVQIEKRSSEIEKDERFQKQAAAQARREAAERSAASRLIASVNAPQPPALDRLLSDLEISHWRREAASPDREDSLSAQRVLERLFFDSAFALPQTLIERKEYARAALSLSVAIEIHPDNPAAWYGRACARARAGEKKKALEDLRTAIQKGFRDRSKMETDSDLQPLRSEPEFQAIVNGLPAAEPTPSNSR